MAFIGFENSFSAKDGPLHLSSEGLTQIGRNRMFDVKCLFVHLEGGVGIPDAKISIHSNCKMPFFLKS